MDQDDIFINGEIGDNLVKIYTQICLNLQEKYDISPQIINEILNHGEFIKKSVKINEKFGGELQELFLRIDADVERIKEVETGTNMTESNHEGETCGYIIKEYPNGYKKYCNLHKYIHAGDKETGQFIGINTHEFVFKTAEQIQDEKTIETKMSYYQAYMDNLLNVLTDMINLHIKTDYMPVRIKIEHILAINDWLKSKKDIFKTKFVSKVVTASPQMGEDKYVYCEYIDVYIPNSKSAEYLKDIQNLETPYLI